MSTPFPIITEYKVFGAEDVMRAQKEIIESFRAGELTTKEFNAALRENTKESREMNRAYSGLRMTTRVQNYEFQQSLQIMRGIGNIGSSLLNIWQAYEVGQIRVDRAVRDVADANKEVAKWQSLYNQYLRDFGTDSALAQDALDNYNDALQNQASAQAAASKAINDMNFGYVAMGLSAVGVTAQVGSLYLKIQQNGGALASLKELATGFESVAIAAAPLIALVAAIAGAKITSANLAAESRAQGLTPEMVPEPLKKVLFPGASAQNFGLGAPFFGPSPVNFTQNNVINKTVDIENVASRLEEMVKKALGKNFP